MTYEAIIFVNQEKNKNFLLEKLNGKKFLHYQLNYLSENLFKKIVFVESNTEPSLKSSFGDSYLDMELVYANYEKNQSESQALLKAFEYIDDLYAFVFDAHHLFRVNLIKADDFRRMRDSKMLHIGKKAEDYYNESLPHMLLDVKGKIEEINKLKVAGEADTFYSNTWLINKLFFQKQFKSAEADLLHLLDEACKKSPQYCLACRQYFIEISSVKDLEKAENDFKENHFQ
jgi:NDP-sugar pyrophosphorylase family protein